MITENIRRIPSAALAFIKDIWNKIRNTKDILAKIRKFAADVSIIIVFIFFAVVLVTELFFKKSLSINHVYITNKASAENIDEDLIIRGIYSRLKYHIANLESRGKIISPEIRIPKLNMPIIKDIPPQVIEVEIADKDFSKIYDENRITQCQDVELAFNIPGVNITFDRIISILRYYLKRENIDIYGYVYKINNRDHIKLYGTRNFITTPIEFNLNNIYS